MQGSAGISPPPAFTIRMKAEIILDVVDSKSMLVHHSWHWELHNVNETQFNDVEFVAASVVQRKLEDIHFKAFDEHGIEIKKVRVTINQPYNKALAIGFDRTILPNEDVKVVLEYDWEEPDRKYTYNFQVPYSQFKFVLSYPRELAISAGINKVAFSGSTIEPDVHVQQPFMKTRSTEKDILTWEVHDVMPPVGYRLRW